MNRLIIYILLLMALLIPAAQAAWLTAIDQTLVQPNGDTVHCLASGDEFYHWLHDKDTYTIVKDPSTGYWVYATVVADKIGASPYVVGDVDPVAVGLQKGIKISNEEYYQRRAEWGEYESLRDAPTTGTINSIVVFLRFFDDPSFATPYSYFDDIFNSTSPNDPSVYNYWKEVSYDQLWMPTYFYPRPMDNVTVSYRDSLPRAYYQPYDSVTNDIGYQNNSQRIAREHILLRAAAQSVDGQIPDTLQVDRNSDGLVDMMTFIIQGSEDAWGDLIWPHRTRMTSFTYRINGARLYDYNLMMEDRYINGIGTTCHEMFHVMGAPDLYHYDTLWSYMEPVGRWGLMDEQGNPPHHILSYMKDKYAGWISLPLMTAGGYYTLNDLTQEAHNAIRLKTNAAPGAEEWVVEYRHDKPPFEISIPDSGLIIYRTDRTINGNANGPLDEVYVYRPGGSWNVNGDINEADFSADEGKTHFTNLSDPWCFTSLYTPGNLFIADIGYLGSTMTFYFGAAFQALFGGAVGGNWNQTANGFVYWIRDDSYTNSGVNLDVVNGARIYGEAMKTLSSHGTINFQSGASWTRVHSIEHFRAGIKSRGQIKMYNGADIRFR